MFRLFRPFIVLPPNESRLDSDYRPSVDGQQNGKSFPGLRFASRNSFTRNLHLCSPSRSADVHYHHRGPELSHTRNGVATIASFAEHFNVGISF
jgi:hypothetical protein